MGDGGFEDKALYFCMCVCCGGGGVAGRGVGGGEAVFFFFFFFFCFFVVVLFFQSSGQLAFVKMYNFLQVMVLLKNAVYSNGICWNEKKKFLFLEDGSPEEKKRVMRVPWWWC